MASKNMWGDLSKLETVRSPKAILQEQAQYLTQATGGVLVGDVVWITLSSPHMFRYHLDIQVPALNNYAYTVFSIHHLAQLYPVTVRCDKPAMELECQDEQKFEYTIGSILGSEEVKQILARLLSQAT